MTQVDDYKVVLEPLDKAWRSTLQLRTINQRFHLGIEGERSMFSFKDLSAEAGADRRGGRAMCPPSPSGTAHTGAEGAP